MKLADRFAIAVILIGAAGILIASQPEQRKWHWSDCPIDYTDQATGCAGRSLTPAEFALVEACIESIAGDNPYDTLIATGANFDPCTTLRGAIAWDLWLQLWGGRIEAETLKTKNPKDKSNATVKPDCTRSTSGDQMNISNKLLQDVLADPSLLKKLQGVLVHEWVHKQQDAATLRHIASREFEAYGMQMAYLCSARVLPENEERKRVKKSRDFYQGHTINGTPNEQLTDNYIGDNRDDTHYYYIARDTSNTGPDTLISYGVDGSAGISYPLGGMRAADFLIFNDYPLYPPGHSLGLIFGGTMLGDGALIMALHLFEGNVVEPPLVLNFSPPPMFFSSADYSEDREVFYVFDGLEKRILILSDLNFDLIPDFISGEYAGPFTPGFEMLIGARGVDIGEHPQLGWGITANRFGQHIPEHSYPYDFHFFLPDLNFDNVADLMIPVSLYEFMTFKPVFHAQPLWAEQMNVFIHGTWEHDIGVFISDSLGENLFAQIGVLHMSPTIDGECLLMQPLLAGMFVIPVDLVNGARLNLAVKVIDPTPRNLTLAYDPDGQLHLRWEAVEGAESYHIYGSADGVNYGWTGDITETTEFVMPLIDQRFFYQVKAVR